MITVLWGKIHYLGHWMEWAIETALKLDLPTSESLRPAPYI
jgi:hypothetical protein